VWSVPPGDEAYAQRHGYASPGEAVEAVTWKLGAVGTGARLALPRVARSGSLDAALRSRRPVYFPEKGGYVETPVYVRDRLPAGAELAGPAVVEERESTTVLPPGCAARVDEYGSLLVEVRPRTERRSATRAGGATGRGERAVKPDAKGRQPWR